MDVLCTKSQNVADRSKMHNPTLLAELALLFELHKVHTIAQLLSRDKQIRTLNSSTPSYCMHLFLVWSLRDNKASKNTVEEIRDTTSITQSGPTKEKDRDRDGDGDRLNKGSHLVQTRMFF